MLGLKKNGQLWEDYDRSENMRQVYKLGETYQDLIGFFWIFLCLQR